MAYSQIGDLRSILPERVHILALTATLTTTVFEVVKKRLSLNDPAVIGTSPNRANIKYHVEPKETIATLRGLLSDKLLAMRTKFPKTLVFFKTVAECAAMYKHIRRALGKYFTEPPKYPDYHQFRMVDMYTRPTSEPMKKKILNSYQTAGSKLRILFATTAFSMGIDCPDIENVIHCGAPSTVEQYVQETGRAGRNGEPAVALLYGKPGKHVDEAMGKYCSNSKECRRHALFQNFLFYEDDKSMLETCKCCDICALKCRCNDCK